MEYILQIPNMPHWAPGSVTLAWGQGPLCAHTVPASVMMSGHDFTPVAQDQRTTQKPHPNKYLVSVGMRRYTSSPNNLPNNGQQVICAAPLKSLVPFIYSEALLNSTRMWRCSEIGFRAVLFRRSRKSEADGNVSRQCLTAPSTLKSEHPDL